MELYKTTDENGYTHGNTYWEEGTTHQVKWSGKMCQAGCIHAYIHPILAVIYDPLHTNNLSRGGKLFKAKGKVYLNDGTKVGCKKLTTLEEIEVPTVTEIQKKALCLLIAKEVASLELKGDLLTDWNNWADNWLSGKDRTWQATDKIYWKVFRTMMPTEMPTATLMEMPTVMQTATPTAMAMVMAMAFEKKPDIDMVDLCNQAMKIS